MDGFLGDCHWRTVISDWSLIRERSLIVWLMFLPKFLLRV